VIKNFPAKTFEDMEGPSSLTREEMLLCYSFLPIPCPDEKLVVEFLSDCSNPRIQLVALREAARASRDASIVRALLEVLYNQKIRYVTKSLVGATINALLFAVASTHAWQ
jgi:hypothetical protein